ncbi:restriction endonuclease subunit S [Phascolarctobacterium succinatutens]|uniref:restriction endonuclease subunit S n=1 Tax=Phascolarctobacterium succinatutens TaxID=626940 RepID=UPI003080C2F0
MEEYKKSVITEAVTKGLNPDAEMKDSGIEYIGITPIHWNKYRLKYILLERNIRTTTGEEMLLSVSQYKGVVPSKDINNRTMQANSLIGYKIVKKDDLVFNKLNPGLARFGNSEFDGITSPDFSVYIVDDKKCTAKFLQHLLKTYKYVAKIKGDCTGVGDGFARLYSEQLYRFVVSLPPIEELHSIVAYIDSKSSEIDALIADKKRQLDILADYKKSLIYEYVTGKKEVPVNE